MDFLFFVVVVIGLGDAKKCMSCCPMVLLFFFCSTAHLWFKSCRSTFSCHKGKNVCFFFLLTKEEAQKYL